MRFQTLFFIFSYLFIASFLIPYFVILILAGLPLFLMEMSFGQFSSLGPISAWNAVPLFRGWFYSYNKCI